MSAIWAGTPAPHRKKKHQPSYVEQERRFQAAKAKRAKELKSDAALRQLAQKAIRERNRSAELDKGMDRMIGAINKKSKDLGLDFVGPQVTHLPKQRLTQNQITMRERVNDTTNDKWAKPHRKLNAAGIGATLDDVLSGKNKVVNTAVGGAAKGLGAAVHALVIDVPEVVGDAIVPGADKHDSNVDKVAGKVFRNLGRELVDIPANIIPSLYVPAKKAVEGDPVGAAKMFTDPLVELATHPGKSFTEHPLGSALMATGAVRGVDRLAGKTERVVTGVNHARPDTVVEGTAMANKREAARGFVSRRIQKKLDESKTRKKGVHRMSDGQITRRVDERISAAEDIRRREVQGAAKDARKAIGAKPTAAINLTSQHIVKASLEDLVRYRDEIRTNKDIPQELKAQQKTTLKLIDKAIKKYDPGKVEVAARRYSEFSRKQQAELAELYGQGERLQHRAVQPFAVRQLGARKLSKEELAANVEKTAQELINAREEAGRQGKMVEPSMVGYGVAQGRAQILSRNVSSTRGEKVAMQKTVKDGQNQFAGGGRGVEQAAEGLQASLQNAKSATAYVTMAKRAHNRALEAERTGGQLHVKEGDKWVPISQKEIRTKMKEAGLPEPAYITHAPNKRGPKAFYISTDRPAAIGDKSFSGKAQTMGVQDAHPMAMVEQAARTQGLITTAREFGNTAKEFSMRKDSGRGAVEHGTYQQMADLATKAARKDDGITWRPYRLNAFKGTEEQLQLMMQRINDDDAGAFDQVKDKMAQALAPPLNEAAKEGEWGLMPTQVAEHWSRHIERLTPDTVGRAMNLYGSMFRRTVLSLSPKWLTGNVVEAALRAAFAHAGPRSLYTGYQIGKKIQEQSPEAAKSYNALVRGGGHYSLGYRNSVHTQAEHFAGTKLGNLALVLGKMRRTPGPKNVADGFKAYTDFIFHTLNGNFETVIQTALAGKAARDSHLMSGHVVKLSNKAIDQAAQGLRGTNEQVALGRAVDHMYGKYSKFTPRQRRAVATWSPFFAWTLNAAKFVFDVLPRDHPVALGLMASITASTEEARKEFGLAKFMEGELPSYMMGSVPAGDNKLLRASRYTPFGAFGNYFETASNLVLPQVNASLLNLGGYDWKMKKQKHEDGTDFTEYENLLQAALSMVEASIPGIGQTHRIIDNPGNLGAKLNKEFNPARPTDWNMETTNSEPRSPGPSARAGSPGAGREAGPSARGR